VFSQVGSVLKFQQPPPGADIPPPAPPAGPAGICSKAVKNKPRRIKMKINGNFTFIQISF
jgi:hypothetical protein